MEGAAGVATDGNGGLVLPGVSIWCPSSSRRSSTPPAKRFATGVFPRSVDPFLLLRACNIRECPCERLLVCSQLFLQLFTMITSARKSKVKVRTDLGQRPRSLMRLPKVSGRHIVCYLVFVCRVHGPSWRTLWTGRSPTT